MPIVSSSLLGYNDLTMGSIIHAGYQRDSIALGLLFLLHSKGHGVKPHLFDHRYQAVRARG